MFNEAIGNLSARGEWYSRTGKSTLLRSTDDSSQRQEGAGTFAAELVETGPWVIDGVIDAGSSIHFYR